VLFASSDGSSVAEVARSLFPSEGTVRSNPPVGRDPELKARNRADAARIANEKGWL
jgi:two-component system response regulator DesR